MRGPYPYYGQNFLLCSVPSHHATGAPSIGSYHNLIHVQMIAPRKSLLELPNKCLAFSFPQPIMIHLNTMLLTLQPRIQHIKRHLITLRRARNCHQALIAIILRFIDLNHTATQLTNLIDLCSSLADDRTDHVVWNIDLLRQWLAWHNTLHRLDRWAGMASCCWSAVTAHLWLLWTDTAVCSSSWATAISDWSNTTLYWDWSRANLWVCLLWIWSRTAASARIVVLQVMGVAVAASRRVWDVWDNLHAAWDNASWAAAAGSVGGCGWAAETGGELLEESGGDIVGGDVDGVCDTEDDEGPLRREWEVLVGRVESCSRLLLDFLDACSSLADNGSYENIWDEKAKRVCSGLCAGSLLKCLAVKCADDQAECLS